MNILELFGNLTRILMSTFMLPTLNLTLHSWMKSLSDERITDVCDASPSQQSLTYTEKKQINVRRERERERKCFDCACLQKLVRRVAWAWLLRDPAKQRDSMPSSATVPRKLSWARCNNTLPRSHICTRSLSPSLSLPSLSIFLYFNFHIPRLTPLRLSAPWLRLLLSLPSPESCSST